MFPAGSSVGWVNDSAEQSSWSIGCRCYWACSQRKECLPLEFKPACSIGDLLTQHLDELEQEAERKGGVMQILSNHFAQIFKLDIAHSVSRWQAA